jgi:hypothetical protein
MRISILREREAVWYSCSKFFYFLEFLLQRRLGKLFLTCKNFYLFLVAKRAVKSKERSQSQEGEEKEGGGKLTMPTSEGPTLATLPVVREAS